ncbi:apolipoprotein L6-like [Acomys russatus]|uniref:apolipoprotein L6-like n=1 Tax=Acomys russatus TaxID=60746 RepID=UPI0021E28106|nr:apolipoprotein L6-like [Acomys russatus]
MALVQTPVLNHLTGEEYEADVELQRGKDDGPLGGDLTDEEEAQVEDDALTEKERTFLKEFPSWEKNEKEKIRKLYAIADDIDKKHRKATKIKIVTDSASVVSGVMSLLGLVLAPTTSGASLLLSAAGQGLGALAGVTNIITNIKEGFHEERAQAQANSIMPASDRELEDTKGKKTSYVTAAGDIVYKCGSAWENIRKHKRALQITKTHPHVTSVAKELMTAGESLTQNSRQVQKAFGGTALAMTKTALLRKGVGDAIFLGLNIYDLIEEYKDLKSKKPTDFVKELRMRAQEWEREISKLTCYYKKLTKVRVGLRKGLGDKLRFVEPCRTARVKGA